jgi:hypothetical protein
VLKWIAEQFMRAEAEFERIVFVVDVVFPNGVVQDGQVARLLQGRRYGHGRRRLHSRCIV